MRWNGAPVPDSRARRPSPRCSSSITTVEAGSAVTTQQISLVHLAKSEIHEAGVDICNFAYRASGGAGLRAGVIQRTFREMMVAANHFTIAPSIVTSAGRNIGGQWTNRVWQFYDLIEKK